MKSLALALLLALVSPQLFASGDDANLIVIKDFQFIPQHITIGKGQTLVWENSEKRQYHSVWFEALGEDEPEDYLFSEDIYQRSFDEVGRFPYRCAYHPQMTAEISVKDG